MAFVVSMDLHRWHLTKDQQKKLAKEILQRNPERSNRSIATDVGIDDHTVSRPFATKSKASRLMRNFRIRRPTMEFPTQNNPSVAEAKSSEKSVRIEHTGGHRSDMPPANNQVRPTDDGRAAAGLACAAPLVQGGRYLIEESGSQWTRLWSGRDSKSWSHKGHNSFRRGPLAPGNGRRNSRPVLLKALTGMLPRSF